jgi:hypothetical protein
MSMKDGNLRPRAFRQKDDIIVSPGHPGRFPRHATRHARTSIGLICHTSALGKRLVESAPGCGPPGLDLGMHFRDTLQPVKTALGLRDDFRMLVQNTLGTAQRTTESYPTFGSLNTTSNWAGSGQKPAITWHPTSPSIRYRTAVWNCWKHRPSWLTRSYRTVCQSPSRKTLRTFETALAPFPKL